MLRRTVATWLKHYPAPTVHTRRSNPLATRNRARQRQARELLKGEMEREADAMEARAGKRPLAQKRGVTRRAATAQRGSEVAEAAKLMSDQQWEGVTLADRHAFVKHMAARIADAPADVTEQQRRRYYETTARDPRDERPAETVADTAQRLKLGLPVVSTADRSLGVTDAMHDSAEASMFDPMESHRIEHAMTNVKQLFVDYVGKKKQGVSTEAERRALARASEELNHQTQRHLASMFRHAEAKVQDAVEEQRRDQLARIAAARARLASRRGTKAKQPKKGKAADAALRKAYGIDITTAKTLWRQLAAQEKFLQLCEVMVRMTSGSGFAHTPQDEGLDEYAGRLQDVYSVDPERLGRLDAVQYLAATEGVGPVDWAARWYERALVLPLQELPEHREVEQLREEEAAAVGASREEPSGDDDVVHIAQRMFAPPSQGGTVYEQRLRYVAQLHMTSQIKQMRRNARAFRDAASAPEAERCRELHHELSQLRAAADAAGEGAHLFERGDARALYEEMQALARGYIARTEGAAKKPHRIKRVQAALKAGDADVVAAEARRVQQRQKRQQVRRLLRLLEKDVREDMQWVDSMRESERPALLPVPEPMSYVSAADVRAWTDLRAEADKQKADPFAAASFRPTFLGQAWQIPDKPTLFWGTGAAAVEQALKHAAEDAEMRRTGAELPPPYPCAENPWGWRLRRDPLDEE